MADRSLESGADVGISRRQLLRSLGGTLAIGGAAAGIALVPPARKFVLDRTSELNDVVQSGLYHPDRLAQEYSLEEITSPFPYNGFLPEAYAPKVDVSSWRLVLTGRMPQSTELTLDDIREMHKHTQITRLICIEGWSAIGQWAGVRLSDVLKRVDADLSSKYLVFRCADDYVTSIDMASALHPQTILAYEFLDNPLPEPFGAPLRLRIPTKLGFKNAKYLHSIEVTNRFAGGFWEDQGYNWFAGL